MPIASQMLNFLSCVPKFEKKPKILQVYGTVEPHRNVEKGVLFAKCINFLRIFFPYCECFLLLFLWVMYIYFFPLGC